LSEESTFLALGDIGRVKQVTGQEQNVLLADPQQMNSYSYGRDNPIMRPNWTYFQVSNRDILQGTLWSWFDYDG
jgi:hypothetical protein